MLYLVFARRHYLERFCLRPFVLTSSSVCCSANVPADPSRILGFIFQCASPPQAFPSAKCPLRLFHRDPCPFLVIPLQLPALLAAIPLRNCSLRNARFFSNEPFLSRRVHLSRQFLIGFGVNVLVLPPSPPTLFF